MLWKISIGVLVCMLAAIAQDTDYCHLKSCLKFHIACDNNGDLSARCPAEAAMVDLSPYIASIVRFHNVRRNIVAGGNEKGYQPATRMATMLWDDELATIAAYTVKLCTMQNDYCRNTNAFSYSGQNMATYSYTGDKSGHGDEEIIDGRLTNWWGEIKDCKMSFIDKYKSKTPCGHFTVMVADKNSRIGCAAIRYKDGIWNTMQIACHYATTNLLNEAIYVAGKTASKCQSGTNPLYRNLCSEKEEYTDL